MISAGRLRGVVSIMQAAKVDKDGGYETSWAAVDTVRAEVVGLTGREVVMDRTLQGITTYRIRIRWRPDVTQANQLLYGDETLNIRSAVDPDGKRRELVIIADNEAVLS